MQLYILFFILVVVCIQITFFIFRWQPTVHCIQGQQICHVFVHDYYKPVKTARSTPLQGEQKFAEILLDLCQNTLR